MAFDDDTNTLNETETLKVDELLAVLWNIPSNHWYRQHITSSAIQKLRLPWDVTSFRTIITPSQLGRKVAEEFKGSYLEVEVKKYSSGTATLETYMTRSACAVSVLKVLPSYSEIGAETEMLAAALEDTVSCEVGSPIGAYQFERTLLRQLH
jgi:hypothetical protein